MIYNKLNNSYLGFGFMRHDMNDFEKTQQLVDYAMSHGINYYEVASFYLDFHCEEIAAKALKKYPRDSYKLCNKFDILNAREACHKGIIEPFLQNLFDSQLKNCQTDYFDYYLIQAMDRNVIKYLKDYPIYDFFKKKKEEGLIKNFGFSFHDDHTTLKYFLDNYEWDCCQIHLNYYTWYLGEGKLLYNELKSRNMPMFIMGPLHGGRLINGHPQQIRDFFPMNYLIHLGMHFLQTLSGVDMILTGANELSQLQFNIDLINNYSFTAQDKENLDKIIKIHQQVKQINCTNCGYCLTACPMKVKISDFFQLYNAFMFDPIGNAEARTEYISKVKEFGSYYNCIQCGKCKDRCPQHLDIPKLILTNLYSIKI